MSLQELKSYTLFSALVFFILLTACDRESIPLEETGISTPPSLLEQDISESVVIKLSERQADDLNIETHRVTRDTISYWMSAPGQVFPAPENISMISAPVNGRVTRIFAHEGEQVNQGSPLLELESLEFAELAANYMESVAEENYYRQQVDRLNRLVEQRISPQSTLDRAVADYSRAGARVRAARARLRAIGLDEQQISQWNVEEEEDERATLIIYSPIDGIINRHLIDLGQAVNAYDLMMDILNTDQVLVRGYVAPEEAPLLQPGSRLLIFQRSNYQTVDRGFELQAEITTINPALDEVNRSIVINSIIRTQNQWPVIGQNVRLQVEARTTGPVITVPLSAIQFEGRDATVFIRQDEFNYERRPILLRKILDEMAIVESGLHEGEEVAVTQVFSLKALGKFEEFAEE